MEFDTSELDRLATELGQAPVEVAKGIAPVVRKGALNIKNQLRDEMGESTHFKQVVSSITYETHARGDGHEAEIGAVTQGKVVGDLAHFAYFGGANGGGGTVKDPEGALKDEAPRFIEALEDLIRDAL